MFVEFTEDEQRKLSELGYKKTASPKFYFSNENAYFMLSKHPKGSLKLQMSFTDSDDVETIEFPTFDSFYKLTTFYIYS